MKKVFMFLLLGFMFLLGLKVISNVQADEAIIDLYPYDQEACLLAESACTYTKVGSSHWTMTYFGHRYHFVKDVMRYGHEMVDDNSDGWIDDNELSGLAWNAFATVFMNNTASQIDILTANSRTDITDVVHRKYAHFDENGVLQMFEDHISRYYIYNDGDATTPDWRLATEAEVTAYQAEVTAETISSGDPSSDGSTRYTHIRIALDDTDTDGYVVEPIGYLKWTNADVDTTVELDPTKWSTIIADDPNNLYIPAGWTVVTFGTNDRGTLNTKTRDYIESLPAAMVDTTVEPMMMAYEDQPAMFDGVYELDDDAMTPGVNVVVDYNGTYTLPTGISASWVNMFDDTDDSVINSIEPLDYSFEIYQDDSLLETITYTWNETTEVYDASGEQTVIDTSVFGSGYVGVYSVETPEGDVTEIEVDIVIGVMPPKFMGVEDRYVNEDSFVDVLHGISADDGYGNDLTNSIMVTLPEELNPYFPQPGSYEIELEFTHHVHFDGVESTLDYSYDGTDYNFTWDPATQLNQDVDINVACRTSEVPFCAWNDTEHFVDSATSWGSVIIIVGADGKIDEIYNRYTWDYTDETGTTNDGGAGFDDWQANVTIEEGGFALGAHGSASAAAQWRYMAYDDVVNLVVGTPDFDYDIMTETSYMLTVDDRTAPHLLVVDDNYTIDSTDFDSVNDAILANVVSFDNFDPTEDLAIYVSDNGGLLLDTPDTYTVEVTVEDMAGNSAMVEFDIEVVAAPIILTSAQIQTLIADNSMDQTEVQAMIDAIDLLTDTEVQAMIDAIDLLTDAEVQAMIDAIDLLTVAEVQAMLDDQTLTQAEIQTLIDDNVMTEEDVQGLIDAVDILTDAEVQTMIDDSITEIPETGCGSSGRIQVPSFGLIGILGLLGATIVIFRRHN